MAAGNRVVEQFR